MNSFILPYFYIKVNFMLIFLYINNFWLIIQKFHDIIMVTGVLKRTQNNR
mgnify:CR=1 FL=1